MKNQRASILFCFLLAFGCLNAQSLPPNMYADSAYAPFLYGVASFEPTDDAVILWTKIDPQGSSLPLTLTYEIFLDSGLTNPVGSSTVTTDIWSDWIAKKDISNLQPGTHYWYRWRDAQGNYSRVGRTKTAPTGQREQVRLAVMSCSSIYSGYFNAYKRISERDDIDLVIHLGDYIYDFVDADEQVRVPVPAPIDPQTLAEWRERHSYYLLDPDLRAARQNHPWVAIWDNHDIDGATPQYRYEAMQAFQDYLPIRLNNIGNRELIYRRIAYGDLLDILLVDATSLSEQDTLLGGEFNMLGAAQMDWLKQALSNSTATWRVIGQQRMMGQFSTAGLGSLVSFGDGPVADSSAWDGFNATRSEILDYLGQNGIDNNVVLSGDIHTSFLCDLPIDLGSYNSQTGAGSMAVEFLPTSITRGNFDEAGVSGFLIPLVQAAISVANPHHVFSQLTNHGYGVLDIRPDTVTAEFWYSPILQVSNTETFAAGYRCLSGENHWQRSATNGPTTLVGNSENLLEAVEVAVVAFPNPTSDELQLLVSSKKTTDVEVRMVEIGSGRIVYAQAGIRLKPTETTKIVIETALFAAGAYQIVLKTDGAQTALPIHLVH